MLEFILCHFKSILQLCLKSFILTSRAAGVAPSRDQTFGSSTGTAGGQGHGADVAVQAGGFVQLDQHDVIVQVVATVPGVTDDLNRADELLCALVDSNVVLTETHLDAAAGTHQVR